MTSVIQSVLSRNNILAACCAVCAVVTLSPVHAVPRAKIRISTQSIQWAGEVSTPLVDAVAGSNAIDIDTGTKYQTIDAFGGCFNELEWKAIQSLPQAKIDSVLGALFDTVTGCRFNICRLPIGANDYALNWYSLNETVNDTLMTKINIDRDKTNLIPFIKAALAYNPNLKIWASPWSPPTWMKTNTNYTGLNSGFKQQPAFLQAYAQYLSKGVKLFQSEGINCYALSFQNEPYAQSVYPGCIWSAAQMRDFIKLYLGPRFDTDQLNCEIWTPTMNNGEIANFKTMLDDAGCMKYIKTACFQWEAKNAVAGVHALYPTLKLYQTENECGSGVNDWAYAENPTFYYMKFYFDNGASGYMQWNMALEQEGLSTWDWPQNSMISIDTAAKKIIFNPQYYAVKHFSFYVRPGAKKIKTAGSYANQVGFLNPDNSVVVVANNTGTSAVPLNVRCGSKMISVSLPGKSFATYIFYDSIGAAISPPSKRGLSRQAGLLRVMRSGNRLMVTPGGAVFAIRILASNGSVLSSVSSTSGGALTIPLNKMAGGMYFITGVVDGKECHVTVPVF